MDNERVDAFIRAMGFIPTDQLRDQVRAGMAAVGVQPPAEAQPVAYADPQAFANFKERGHLGGPHGREWMWAKPDAGLVPLYAHPPPSAPVGVEGLIERWKRDAARCKADRYTDAAIVKLDCAQQLANLAQQPAADGGFTAADMMDARQEGREEAQQPAAVDDAMVERAAKELRDLHREFGDGADLPEKIALEIAEAVLAAALAQQSAAIPRLANCGQYMAFDHTGQYYYLNHANTWQTFQGQQPAAVEPSP